MTREYDEDELKVLHAGDAAERLLADADFKAVTDAYVARKVNELVHTAPDQQEDRERLYHHVSAVGELMNELIQKVAQRDNLLEPPNEDLYA
jgi:hypothetical protein